MSTFFLGPGQSPAPEDDALQAEAAELALAWQGRLPDAGQLAQLSARHGLALATAAFYQAVCRSLRHGPFVQQVNEQALIMTPGRRQLDLLVVPALFYQEKPQFGGDGRALAELATGRGHRVAIAPLLSRGSMMANAERLVRYVDQAVAAPFWLVSLSKGGGEVRLALQMHPSDPVWQKVAGWLNISGLVQGTPLVRRHQLTLQAFFRLAGVDPQTARELHPDYPAWRTPWQPPAHWQVISVVGVPLKHHIRQRNTRWRYTQLARHGPNDGMALLPDLVIPAGLVYPLWGADHFLQSPAVPLQMTQLLAYLEEEEQGSAGTVRL
ncbi:MAG TPA: hypothetical protein PKE45_06945 [Caldilineaceae bacterium]|nr:hypothetical protein [Caldilineaceae bacterium]